MASLTPRSGDLLPDARAGRRRQLLPEPGGRRLVHLQQPFALGGAGPLLVVLFELRHRHPEALRELLHRVLEADLLVQLEKLEDVAADAAAEAVKEPLVAIDVERRRLLAVKRAEPLVRGAGLLQRHVVLDHDDDVGVVLQVVDELLRE